VRERNLSSPIWGGGRGGGGGCPGLSSSHKKLRSRGEYRRKTDERLISTNWVGNENSWEENIPARKGKNSGPSIPYWKRETSKKNFDVYLQSNKEIKTEGGINHQGGERAGKRLGD